MTTNPSLSGVEGTGKVVKRGSAWISARANEPIALQTYSSDPKYKKYVQQVEKCLNSFDNVHEWADCIAFLKQMLKTFQSYMQFKEIPRKLIVAKRLAQCLNPALPTGVHQRALEVYTHILGVLSTEGLKRDLSLWSSGLFPFFEYAATSVKPTLLNMYETHYLPLQTGLRPIMKSFILALLPGLEEETGEFFEKVLGLLDKLSGTVSMSFFFQNIWLVMLTTPSARGTSLNFLARRLPQLNADEDISDVVGKDVGLMIRAFSAALEDENLLVRRGALDILLQTMRIDSHGIRKAHKDDRAILMRAATGVVLRRDLSLNRRLYTWLLGPDEKSDHQIAYLRENALELLSSTLKSEMVSPSGEYAESRPFKIFISLLDKWEIGAPLTEILVYDAFKAIRNLVQNPTESGEDLTMTASTLYEAVEPQLLWKHLLTSVFTEILGDGTQVEAIRIVHFILESFSHDEEVQTIHLPVIFAALVDLLDHQVEIDPMNAARPSTREAMLLLETVLQYIPHTGLLQRPEITKNVDSDDQRPFDFACSFFKITHKPLQTTSSAHFTTIPFASCFQHLISLSTNSARCLVRHPQNGFILREVLSRSLTLVDRLVGRLVSPIALSWKPSQWLSDLLLGFEHETATFATVDRIISLSIVLHRNQFIQPRLVIDERPVLHCMVRKLLQYLRSDCSAYHVRAVNMIWSLETSTAHSHVESILAQSMTSPISRDDSEAYECFGILWRLTEDTLLPGFRFKVPMMIVLDTLKSDNPTLRRIGETWMRCSLKSYLRVLDPILHDLLDPSILRTPTTFKVRGRELPGFFYDRPFDQRLINHLLEILLSVVNFGGQGFAKAARTSAIKRSHHGGLIERVTKSGLVDVEASYLDVLVEILLRLVQSESRPTLSASMQSLNTVIQSNAIELLQVVVSRGEIDTVSVESIEAIAIGKLYFSIHMNRLDLQNKWLHLLHSVIAVTTSKLETSRRVSASKQEDSPPESATIQDKGLDLSSRYPMNPLLIQTLVDGISSRANRPVLQHWLDFILMAVPQFQPALQALVAPLNDCLCRQVLSSLGDVLRISVKSRHYAEDQSASVTDAELIMLLNGLERLVLLSLAYTSEMDMSEDESNNMEKTTTESSGLLGYVSNVFSSETSASQLEQLTVRSRSPGYRSLDEGIRVLYSVWASLVWKSPQSFSPKDESLALIYTRTRLRCRRVLEHLFRVQSPEVFESIVDWWSRESTLSASSPDAAFELVDVLLSNALNVVHMICESISSRIFGTTEKIKKQAINPNLTDAILFKFLEQYLRRLEGPLAIQVWSRYIQLVKEIISTSREFKAHQFPALRCLGVLAEKVTQTTAMEDRKIRKELQDNYGKLLDLCVVYVGRSTDQGSWIRRSTKDSVASNGRDSPVPRNDSKLDEKPEVTATSIPPETPKLGSAEVILQINSFVATSALPNLRKLLMENDKIISACNNIIYYIVNPAMRGKSRPMDVDSTITTILQEMTRIPAALKSWRTPVIDLLNDNRLFNCNPEDALSWRSIVKVLYDSDKTAFPELLGKVAYAPSANIFTNREYEMLLRSLNLRRLSYVLFTGETNHFLTQLPSIQEKLVDIFRSVTSPIVQSEVFLCIRVLLCRLSPHNLTSFWPVVLTEMVTLSHLHTFIKIEAIFEQCRVFEQTITTLPSDGSEDLQLLLAACKALDLLLVLQTEEFQIHQWIFITDTVDAIYRPDGWFPEAMIDQLSELAGNLPVTESTSTFNTDALTSQVDQRAMRRPLLGSLRQIESIRDLVPFFSNVSISSYESVYASAGNIDWQAVERSIMDDMFDGR
ncbi:Dopey, N-terminal-domain-containing protein [Crassisporium funariophilum]|nr:Dopey, N-terminal-domain-containing protein [Crassisporium funariophilum]